MFFDFGSTDVGVSSEEPKCLVGFCCDVIYMAIPRGCGAPPPPKSGKNMIFLA